MIVLWVQIVRLVLRGYIHRVIRSTKARAPSIIVTQGNKYIADFRLVQLD